MSKSVFTKGFNALLVTQFLGAVNDNLLKEIFILQVAQGGYWGDRFGTGGQGIVTILFTVPFLLFSGWSGQFADKHSKQKVSQWVKIAEIPLALMALLALGIRNVYLGMGALLLLALHSTVFGPAKYGMLPELFKKDELGRANGAINMLTNIAIITGALLGGQFSKHYLDHPLAPGLAMLGVAVLGLVASRFLVPLHVTAPDLKYTPNPVRPYWDAFKIMARDRVLLLLCFGGSFFYLVAIMSVLAFPDFKPILKIGDDYASMMNVPLMVGIAAGSILAGYIHREGVKTLRLVPIATLGLALFLALIGSLDFPVPTEEGGLHDPAFRKMCLLLCGLGTFGGMYIIPFQAMIQARAPESQHGRILGTFNFLTFVFIFLGGGVFKALRGPLDLGIQPVLAVLAGATVAFVAVLLWFLRDQLRARPNEQATDAAEPA